MSEISLQIANKLIFVEGNCVRKKKIPNLSVGEMWKENRFWCRIKMLTTICLFILSTFYSWERVIDFPFPLDVQ